MLCQTSVRMPYLFKSQLRSRTVQMFPCDEFISQSSSDKPLLAHSGSSAGWPKTTLQVSLNAYGTGGWVGGWGGDCP